MDYLPILCELLMDQPRSLNLKNRLMEFTDQNWNSLVEVATIHDIDSILYERFLTLTSEVNIPTDVINHIHKVCLTKAARNTYFLYEAKRIITAFYDIGIPVICLKGLYLVENIYDNISSRSMSDMDFLIKKNDIPRVFSILNDLGYRITTYFDLKEKNLDIKHLPPFINRDGVFVEIHWTILEENEPFNIKASYLWNRAIPATIADVDTLALSLEDLILHLSIHLTYQHNLQLGLRGLFDIGLVIKRYQNQIDWTELFKHAEEWGAGRVVSLTFHLLEDILLLNIPKAYISSLTEQPIPPEIITQAKNQLLNKSQDGLYVTPDLAKLSLQSGFIKKIQLIFSRIFLPKTTMARLYSVNPHSMKIYFYYPVRFYQLLRYHADSALRILKGDQQALASSSRIKSMSTLKLWLSHQE